MKLIIFILNQEERLQEILEAFLELGINGATILDSIGMGRILAHDIPIFAGFQNLLHDTRPGNKTILSVVPEKKIERIIQAIEQIIGSLDDPGNGVFITMPIDQVKGYKEL
jgi:nitrogen regulatory protein P-II 1